MEYLFNKGDRILTSVHEYAANYIAYLQVSRSSKIAMLLPSRVSVHVLNANVDKTCTELHIPQWDCLEEASLCNCTGHDSWLEEPQNTVRQLRIDKGGSGSSSTSMRMEGGFIDCKLLLLMDH